MSASSGRRIHKLERAKQDLVEIFAYLAQRNERAARRFLQEARQAFELILEMPGIGHRWESAIPELKDLRATSVLRRFADYLIFNRPVPDGVQIVSVLHGARDLPALIDSFGEDDSRDPASR